MSKPIGSGRKYFNLESIRKHPEFAEWYGFYLGDGIWQKDRIAILVQDYEYNFMFSKMKRVFNYTPSIRKIKKSPIWELYICSRNLTEWIPKKKIMGFIYENLNTINNCVRGLWEAEGHVSIGNYGCPLVIIGVCNKSHANLIRHALELNDIDYGFKLVKNRKSWSNIYRIWLRVHGIKNFITNIGFLSRRKNEKIIDYKPAYNKPYVLRPRMCKSRWTYQHSYR